jgi:anti-sigma-K factor RskA
MGSGRRVNAHDSDFDCPQLGDAAAYALGALEHDELERYREHLRDCAGCRAEVAELQPVVDELPSSVPRVRAPSVLRDRIVESVRSEAAVLHAAGHAADRPQRARRGRPLRAAPGALLAGGLAAAAVIAIVLAIVLSRAASAPERISRGVVTVGVPTASATLHIRDEHGDLTVAHMPQPGSGRIYEVWLVRRGSAEPAPTSALFGITREGRGAVDVPASLRDVQQVLVTSEPLGGSAHPTRKPVIAVNVS